jgi:hypothetical protein
MGILTREAILKANDLKTEKVEVPEWGGTVIVSTITGEARDRMEAAIWAERRSGEDEVNVRNLRAKIVAACSVDEKGNLLFPNDGDVEALGRKNGKALDRVFEVARRLNGIGQEDIAEMEKNLGATHFASSPTS